MATKGRGITIAYHAPAAPVAGPCVHYWIVESPNGPTVEGVCKHCGETKVYPTVIHDFEPLGQEGYYGRREKAARSRGEW